MLAQRARESSEIAPKCYWPLSGHPQSLDKVDERWRDICSEDATGFKGFTSLGPLCCGQPANHESYDSGGLKIKGTVVKRPEVNRYVGNETKKVPNHTGAVVYFLSEAAGPGELHTAVKIHSREFMFPPNTLFAVVDKQCEQESFEYLPGKMIHVPLITVRATYKVRPASVALELMAAKLASNHNYLHYGGATISKSTQLTQF